MKNIVTLKNIMFETILLIVVTIILFAAAVIFWFAADTIVIERLNNATSTISSTKKNANNKDLERAEQILIVSGVLALIGSIIAIIIAVVGVNRVNDLEKKLYYKRGSTRVLIFIVFILGIGSGALALEARRRITMTTTNNDKQKEIANQIYTAIIIIWAGSVFAIIAFIATYAKPSRAYIEGILCEEKLKDMGKIVIDEDQYTVSYYPLSSVVS